MTALHNLAPAELAAGVRDDTVIAIKGVGKRYHIYDHPQDRLKHMLLWRFGRRYGREFWALRNISLTIRRGEMVGIIGRNGSGKSTLLQIIAGTLSPTEGSVEVNGRVAALLELGSGFNPEFTGRENVFLNGTILGLSHDEIAARFDEIAAFADIGSFIDQPVKMYSSGMFVRLAFAVQACTDPDILIVDEALAVGDIFFSQKCYRRLRELRERGTAILLVSHSMGDIRQYCNSTLVLSRGVAAFQGPSADAIAHYMLLQQPGDEQGERPVEPQTAPAQPTAAPDESWPSDRAAFVDILGAPVVSNGWARCTAVALCDEHGRGARVFKQGSKASIYYEFELFHDIDVPIGGFNIEDHRSVLVHGKNTLQYDEGAVLTRAEAGMRLRFRHDIVLDIAPGAYSFEVGLATIAPEVFERRRQIQTADLYSLITRVCHLTPAGAFQVAPRHILGIPHHAFFGLANLPGAHGASYVRVTSPAPDSTGDASAAGVPS